MATEVLPRTIHSRLHGTVAANLAVRSLLINTL